jgi:hypothetical protein
MKYPRLQLINKGNRLNGMDDSLIGEYVKADEWTILQRLGPQLKNVIILSYKMKAISVDYINKKVYTNHDIKSAMFQKIQEQSKKSFNKDVGNYWGADFLLVYNGEIFTWFFCTTTMREKLNHMSNIIGFPINIESRAEGKSYTFYLPNIERYTNDLWDQFDNYNLIIKDWLM